MAESEYERLGAKVLSLPDVIAQSVGFMGPVFSSAFTVFLVGASLLTLAVDVWWKGLFALPATPHYFALLTRTGCNPPG